MLIYGMGQFARCETTSVYNTTAFLYDRTAAFEEPEQVCEEILAIFNRYGIQPPGVLGDLGAGTGTMSLLLADRGWQVHGIELSESMLTMAQDKVCRYPLALRERLLWTQGDITDFLLPSGAQWDGAVCLCNTINHLSSLEAVDNFLRSVMAALKSGGVLILDSDTQETFERFFNHPPTVVWEDHVTRLTRVCTFELADGRACHKAVLERRDDANWLVVSNEDMTLRYYTEKELFARFIAAGFELMNMESFNPFPSLYQGGFIPKVLWTLRKP